MDDKTTTLKPCPFCGGEARVRAYPHDYAICCYKCDASTRKFFPTREEAERAWNRRATDG